MGTYVLSFIAGLLTSLSPCVLPAIPFVVGSALSQHRWGPLGLGIGMTLSFTIIGVSLASLGSFFGLSSEAIRVGAAALILISGLFLVFSTLQTKFQKWMSPIAQRFDHFANHFLPKGFFGQLILGALLGIIWSPCTGPTLGAAIGLAAQEETRLSATFTMFFFGIGASLPLMMLAFGSHAILKKKKKLISIGQNSKKILGFLLIITGLAVILGWDRIFESLLVDLLPEWFLSLTTSI